MEERIDSVWIRARERALDLLFPPLCMMCREQVGVAGNLCAACWQKIQFLDGPCCACCGLPFEFDPGEGTLCAACHARPPAFDKARAVMRYDDGSKGPILAFKHADRLDHVPGFARWLMRSGRALLEEADVIVPVPLHRRRLWTRRYNQAAELARALAKLGGKQARPRILLRAKPTPSQGEMPSARARRRNVQGAFIIGATSKPLVYGKVVLLIDDVLTTGATVEACARALKRAGARKVHVLALARVVRPLSSDI
jgi:ComF family protein